MNETPIISNSNYVSNKIDFVRKLQKIDDDVIAATAMGARAQAPVVVWKEEDYSVSQPESTMRIVKVIIADINDNVPLTKRILYNGDETLTDATDQELFFDVNISEILKAHNEYRVTLNDNKATEKFGREIKLEPVRIRDLKMVVVNIAIFK